MGISMAGMLAALALLAVGFLVLPSPEKSPMAGTFSALWLLITAISALAFGRELRRLIRLNRLRQRWRKAAKIPQRRLAAHRSRRSYLRERERRLD